MFQQVFRQPRQFLCNQQGISSTVMLLIFVAISTATTLYFMSSNYNQKRYNQRMFDIKTKKDLTSAIKVIFGHSPSCLATIQQNPMNQVLDYRLSSTNPTLSFPIAQPLLAGPLQIENYQLSTAVATLPDGVAEVILTLEFNRDLGAEKIKLRVIKQAGALIWCSVVNEMTTTSTWNILDSNQNVMGTDAILNLAKNLDATTICNSENEGMLIYNTATDSTYPAGFYLCAATGTWTLLDY